MVFALGITLAFVGIVLFSWAIFYFLSVYNGLIELKNNIDKAWSNIDVLLKQRYDLIPNLVETIKGYKKYEKETLETITKYRTQLVSGNLSSRATADNMITSALKSIFAVSENYPKLQANENFLHLQQELSRVENQIADRREFYNNSVLLYNTKIHSIPDSIIAGGLSMQDKEYFKASFEEKKEVKVKI
ncbi:MAG: LemA family protein [Candidatus Micrarchaeota archaeon]